MKSALLTLLLAVLGCSQVQIPGLQSEPPPMPRPPLPSRQAPLAQAEGSLWRGDASRRFLAFESRAKRVGDLITVQIAEAANATTDATTKLERESNYDANIDSDVSLQTLASRPILRVLRWLGFSDQKSDKSPTANLEIIDADNKSDFEGKGTSEREATFTTTVTCVVSEVLDSGLMRIEGERHLRINRETQVIQIAGWVRPEDVRIDNTIPSTLIANAEVRYDGVGLVTEQQRQPWAARVLNLILPF